MCHILLPAYLCMVFSYILIIKKFMTTAHMYMTDINEQQKNHNKNEVRRSMAGIEGMNPTPTLL